ncbi:MAG TPA: hypothetical protein VHV83_10260 [Armatimonadota bacterium]|jgi:hypothetical protein|nr:hypothetical protein [Armatimonadota bacterium]
MNAEQLALFVAVLAIWVILALGIFPWLPGRTVRRDLRIIGFAVLAVLLIVSLFTAPSFTLWLESMGIAVLILIALLVYNRWAIRAEYQ